MEEKRKYFEQEALQYMDEIYKVAVRLTGNEFEAEDLVQDTYLRAYRFLNSFEEGTCMKAWLLKILRNNFINNFNRQMKEPEILEIGQIKNIDGECALLTDPEEEIIFKIVDDEVRQAINNLPEEFRMVVLLSDVYGFSYREISEILNLPIGTVMSRLHRGRKLLRNSLEKYAKELGYMHDM